MLLETERMWRAVVDRDSSFEGFFYVGVKSTGVYCRPGCPARTPQRKNIEFFSSTEEAERSGFRACLRCHPNDRSPQQKLGDKIRHACKLISENPDDPPSLTELSEAAGLSPSHFQRTFKRLMGVSPKQLAEALRFRKFKQTLQKKGTVADATYEAGFGSSSRVYEQSDERLGMTPDSFKKGGAGAQISYSIVDSQLGKLLVARTRKGVCSIKIADDAEYLRSQLENEFPAAKISENAEAGSYVEAVLQHIDGEEVTLDLPLDIRATAFQLRVWNLIKAIPYGETRTYSELAQELGNPKAARAVARSCATNPVALAIPCHRVVGKDGSLTGYRWGTQRKKQLLDKERDSVSKR